LLILFIKYTNINLKLVNLNLWSCELFGKRVKFEIVHMNYCLFQLLTKKDNVQKWHTQLKSSFALVWPNGIIIDYILHYNIIFY